MKTRIVLVGAVLIVASWLAGGQARAQGFPARGDDTTTSLGTFAILVAPACQPMMVGYPGYDSTTHLVTSPLLFDPVTVIGRSDPFVEGSAADTSGSPTGVAGTIVSDPSFGLEPAGYSPSPPTREVHTQLFSLNLQDLGGLGARVRGGTAAPVQAPSFGQVISQSSSGLPANDFPAKSFFKVFVEVDLPMIGTFRNTQALYVSNANLTTFPPRVIYIHDGSANISAPPVLSEQNLSCVGLNGTFGLLMLAGHGVNYTSSASDQASFSNAMVGQPMLRVLPQYANWGPGLKVLGPPNGIPTLPGPGTVAMAFGLLLLTGVFVLRRRRSSSRM
jgi:MYXO-CTERM domain-containing protein